MSGIEARHVLVGVDGSEDSLVALRWAAWFAGATRRRLVFAHAWQYGRRLDAAFASGCTEPEQIEAEVAGTLRRLAVETDVDLGLVDDFRALRGPSARALSAEADRLRADLIVVGAAGTGGAGRVRLGSVARELTENPSYAVAVVPVHEMDPDLSERPIVVGVDGSDGAARAVRWAADVARRTGSEVVAVHAFESPVPDVAPGQEASLGEERRQRLEEEWCAPLRAAGVDHRAVLDKGDPRDVLPRVADVERPSLGALGSRGLGPFSQRLLGSVTNHLVRELAWPTVVIPSARDRATWPS